MVKIDGSEETPSETTPTTPHGPKNSSARVNQKQDSAEKHTSTVPAEKSKGDGPQKQTQNSRRPSLPNSLLTRRQAASANAMGTRSPTSKGDFVTGEASPSEAPSSDSSAFQAKAIQRSQELG